MHLSSQPIIVLGNPRSGTTLLRLILTSHPSVVIPPEAGFMCWLWKSFSHYTELSWKEEKNLKQFAKAVFGSKKFETWKISEEEIYQKLLDFPPETYREASVLIYHLYLKKNKEEATIWGDKNNFYTSQMPLLMEMFPGARFLHIIRDPRDVVCSYKDMSVLKSSSAYKPQLSTDVAEIAREWRKNNHDVIDNLSTNNKYDYKVLRYEDLVTDSEGEAKKLCQWLELEFDPSMLEFYELNKKYSLEPKETIDWKMNTLQKVSSKQCGRYHKELRQVEIDAIQKVAGDLMRRFWYF